MPKISKKSKEEIYKIGDRMIMDARIEIHKIISNPKELEVVDDILFKLNWQCPKSIIDYFS